MHFRFCSSAAVGITAAFVFGVSAAAQQPPRDTTKLGQVTIIGSPQEIAEAREEAKRQPGSVVLVGPEVIRSSRQANLKDALRFVPGLYIAPRQGASDESQISIRGSGLRNNYHARGLNILINGMPYRNSDGFTDFEALEMMSTEAVTVYKGGNAFRFGGATLGGAIDLHTKTGYTSNHLEVTSQGGSYGLYKGQISSGGVSGNLDWYGAYSKTSLDGYRTHSDQGRDRVNLHLGYLISPKTDVRGFYIFAHVKELYPGVLTPEEAAQDPTQAVPEYVTNKWGRDYDLHHVGFQVRSQLTPAVRLEISPYYQYRDLDHPIFNVLNSQSNDFGAEVRLEAVSGTENRNRLSVGFLPSRLRQANRRFENVLGKHGALAKDQSDEADGRSAYAEDAFRLGKGITAIAGIRYEHQRRATVDHFLSNGDQSDDVNFEAWLPRFGFTADASKNVQFYANVSRSYEPPLIAELNSLTVPGFIDLKASDAWQYEVGTRGQARALNWDVSVYTANLKNEILNLNVEPFPNAGFLIPTYRNSDRTRHSGIEAGLKYARIANLLAAGDLISLEGSYTLNRFTYMRDELYKGNQVPGLPRSVLQGAVRYAHPRGITLSPSIEFVPGRYYVNSENTTQNQGWTVLSVRAEYALSRAKLTLFASAENLTDEQYSGSVQIDAATRQFFEPSDGRSFYAGFRWSR